MSFKSFEEYLNKKQEKYSKGENENQKLEKERLVKMVINIYKNIL